MDRALVIAVERALGTGVARGVPLAGGDVAVAYGVELVDGRRVFVKTHRAPPSGFFSTEAAGLAWIGEARAVDVPSVLAVSDEVPSLLVLSWIERGTARGVTEQDLGRRLAALHRAGAPCFGREDRRTTGSRALPNDPATTWAEFYGTCRLLPLARLAADAGALAPATIDRLRALAGRLADVGGPIEPPARLHGDLWAGNRLVDTQGRSWLIDPAAHGGHREFDLAMMRLFGGFGDDCFAAYEEGFPLAPGWADRVALHQIAPLVVHAIKFGGRYVDAACAAIARYA